MAFIDEKLNKFSAVIMQGAAEERGRILSGLENRKKDELENYENEMLAWAYNKIQREINDIVRRTQVGISKRKNELRRQIIEARRKIQNEVFAEVEKEMRVFAQSAEYAEYFKAEFKRAAEELGTETLKCTVLERDKGLVDTMDMWSIAISVADQDIIGGFILADTIKGRMIDCSLKTKIKDQTDYFLEHSGLFIE